MSRSARDGWVEMEPRRRRRWAAALTAEGLIVCALSAWGLASVVDDDGAVWACFALTAVWWGAFMLCIAVRPSAARRVGLWSAVLVGVAAIGLAYLSAQ